MQTSQHIYKYLILDLPTVSQRKFSEAHFALYNWMVFNLINKDSIITDSQAAEQAGSRPTDWQIDKQVGVKLD